MIAPTLILNETIASPTDGRIYGIHTATREWLRAYIEHTQSSTLSYIANNDDQQKAIVELGTESQKALSLHRLVSHDDIKHCAVYNQLPNAGQFWLRQWQGAKRYSVCGMNHSLSGQHIYDQLRDIFMAPTESWDALICASKASQTVIRQYMDDWSEYLASRASLPPASLRPPLMLPIIPMGTTTSMWERNASLLHLRASLRQKLGLQENDHATLFLGRLNFTSKAHPYPMFQALEEAQLQLGGKLHFLQAGWYPSKDMHRAMQDLASALAPHVVFHYLPANTDEERRAAYAAADSFISLVDNIQESFGLTILEAMAAGLPVIASDWDGYRDTVLQGETGILVPTMMAPAGLGMESALAHGFGTHNYSQYLANVSTATAVNAAAARDALVSIAQSSELRQKLGKAGRQRAVDFFDWRVIMKAHEALWQELDARRQNDAVRHASRNPHYPDPFHLFQSFPSLPYHAESRFQLTKASLHYLAVALKSMTLRAPDTIKNHDLYAQKTVELLNTHRVLTIPEIARLLGLETAQALRLVLWLMKAGVVQSSSSQTTSS